MNPVALHSKLTTLATLLLKDPSVTFTVVQIAFPTSLTLM